MEEEKGALKIAIKKRKNYVSHQKLTLKLTLFLDEDGIVRVGGRIENAYEPYNFRHPVVLDPDHRLITWLIMEAHIGKKKRKAVGLFVYLSDNASRPPRDVYRIDADSFVMAFIRFSRSRGIIPATAYSDNGTNITAGEKLLKNAFDNLVRDQSLPKKLAEKRT